jgi:putative FmdB family regulatory protein
MPIYDYKCECSKEFAEFFTSISKAEEAAKNNEVKCPACSSTNVEKQISRETSHVLKGGGWAKDRYGR